MGRKKTSEQQNTDEALHEGLEKIFHEPHRLSIMSALCAAEKGLSFTQLKERCQMTDGNLNRHLKVLQDTEAIAVNKTFVGVKPRTTISISETGLQRFTEYLEALSDVLKKARQALPKAREHTAPPHAAQSLVIGH